MSSVEINSVLNQIRQYQSQASNQAAAPTPQVGEAGSFGELFKDAVNSVAETQAKSRSAQDSFARGDADTQLSDVMLSVNQASVSFKALAEVRNRLVSSYQDIMNMPI